jgi:16S rRNA processing protein RimM
LGLDDEPVPGETHRVVARVGKPHGLRGEVTVELRTDDPDRRLAPGTVVAVHPEPHGPLTVRSARIHQGVYLVGFEGVQDRTGAERLRGLQLLAAVAEPQGPSGEDLSDAEEYYEDELLGLVVELPSGAPVGTVSALHTRPVQDLLEVRRADDHTVLVPFVSALVPVVDLAGGRVVIDPPAGLLELDR